MNTKLMAVFVIILAAALPQQSMAQNSKFGIGAQLVGPAGISIKADINDKFSLTGATSFIIRDSFSQFTFQANFIVRNYRDEFNIESGTLYSYFGGGIEATFVETIDNQYNLRVPFGIEYEFEDNPLGIYMDLAPTLNIEPGTAFYFNSSLGLRYYFD